MQNFFLKLAFQGKNVLFYSAYYLNTTPTANVSALMSFGRVYSKTSLPYNILP